LGLSAISHQTMVAVAKIMDVSIPKNNTKLLTQWPIDSEELRLGTRRGIKPMNV
jgi:hypothetical protein